MDEVLQKLLAGSHAIDRARDDVRRCLNIVRSTYSEKGLKKEDFTHPDTGRKCWWEIRRGVDGKSFFQLWEILGYNNAERLWEGYADDFPPVEKVMLVRHALSFLLKACLTQFLGFEEKVQPYLSAASET